MRDTAPTRFEVAAATTVALAAAVFLAVVIVTPYPTAGVCAAVGAVSLVIGLLATAVLGVLRWKRGAL
jgi:hypothetical protein